MLNIMGQAGKSINVLLVDDDEINNFISIKLIKKTLLNTDIKACLNGKFAINQLSEIHDKQPDLLPDYILLDINMPVMNGWEFLEEFERLKIDPEGKIKIYIVSSSVFSNDINKSRLFELVTDFISKPLNVEKLRHLFKHEYSN